MGEGDSRSDVSREEAHGHVEREPILFKILRFIFRPLHLLQPAPEDDDMSVSEKRRDPMEDTPAEANRELEDERLGRMPTQK